ncbi:MAG TPA: hypothetical protein VK987_05200, partial [Anaerolineae bacterium]|nr:hypothetical protein [Anaerolineae bacterium]
IIGSVLVGVLGATLSAPTVAMVLRVRDRVSAFQAGELDEAEISAIAAEAELQPRDAGSSAALGR